MALGSLLDPVLNPVLGLHPFYAIVLMSFVIALAMTLVYKWMTDQTLMKSMKDDIKNYQKQMKEQKSDPKKAMEIQKKAMEINMKYMSHSMKPTLISFIPIILIFGWMHANLAYEPLMPWQEFSVEASFIDGVYGNVSLNVPESFTVDSYSKEIIEGKASWIVKASKEGSYVLEFDKEGDVIGKNIIITYKQDYEEPLKNIKGSSFKSLNVIHNPIKPMGDISLFGWKPGWLGVYIITSLIFSMSLRKMLKLS